MGPLRGGEEGEYTCLYQINSKRGLVNSSVSNTVHVTIKGEGISNTSVSVRFLLIVLIKKVNVQVVS